MQMIANGVDPKTALLLTNPYKDTITKQAVWKTKAKFDKLSLTRPDLVKLARNAVKDCLEDKPINGEIYPTHSNKLAAASMVYDRFEPVKSNQAEAPQGNTYIDMSVINNVGMGIPLGIREDKGVIDVK